jgi:nucleoside-diphosphate-sugar epimerase
MTGRLIPLTGRRVALIGGAGFIGHHLALHLHRLGAHVEVVDSLQVNNLVTLTANSEGLPNRDLYLHLVQERIQLMQDAGIPVHIQDARDYTALTKIIGIIEPQAILHLAAVAHAGWASKNPYTTFDHSMRTLENALDIARDTVEHFVFFSSSMVYGNFQSESVTEETHCEPLGIYGALKFGGEKLVIAYNQVFDLPYTIIRPSALYGERCVSRRVGQVFIESALQGRELVVSGDGSDRLDFTYVGDLTQGVARVLEHDRARNEVFNLTYGGSRSIAEMLEIVKSRFPDITVEHQESDRLVPERGTLSIDKARELIGYDPEFPLERGFATYVDWYRDQADDHPALFKVP